MVTPITAGAQSDVTVMVTVLVHVVPAQIKINHDLDNNNKEDSFPTFHRFGVSV